MQIPASAAKTFAETMFKAKKNSPHIFFGLGVIGMVGSVILACRATLKLEETLDEIKSDLEEVNEKTNNAVVHAEGVLVPEIVEKHRVKEVGLVGFKGAVELGKLYGPSVILGGVSIACLAGSHVQLTRRNAALTAAFSALSTAYDDYRERVRQEIGADKELDIYRGIQTVEVEDEKGKKQLVRAVDPNGLSIYARCFDEFCNGWKDNAEFNRTFLQAQEAYANHKLNREGFVFLNEVYEMLGFERTSAGAITGWIKNSNEGDNFIDFGLFEARNARFLNNDHPCIWLDFNVDGVIYDKIP